MTEVHGFDLIRDEEIEELNGRAQLWRHRKTGAQVLSILNDDENKVFGITFPTPVSDSTGVAHILEHSVLGGSVRYPLRDPFVELSRGSLKTFLNAMTFPDRTCYPVASQNRQDFYNLVDVYLDSVLNPRLAEETFLEQGWRFDLPEPTSPLKYAGVVFNEMKGAFSSPDRVFYEKMRSSLFPDNSYFHCSGGDPRQIPGLTYDQFCQFHATFYHPSNARVFFSGDNPVEERLELLSRYLNPFERRPVIAEVALQPPFPAPRQVSGGYPAGNDETRGWMEAVGWVIPESVDAAEILGREVLGHLLMGTAASPLRRALVESELGEDVLGGMATHLRQPYFVAGLRGVAPENAGRVQELTLLTLKQLGDTIEPGAVEAAMNSVEFDLRENNTGSTPRGLSLMMRILPLWQYHDEAFSLLRFEGLLAELRHRVEEGSYFESLVQQFFLQNPHRVTTTLRPDPEQIAAAAREEERRLQEIRAGLTPDEVDTLVQKTAQLRASMDAGDPPAARESLPTLALGDLDRSAKIIPAELIWDGRGLYHDLFASGILYLDLGMNLRALSQDLLPYVPLFGRALLGTGAGQEDYVQLLQRIERTTGGITPNLFASSTRVREESVSWLFLRGKATVAHTRDLLKILRDVLLTARLDNRERFKQMALAAKARMEAALAPSGHSFVGLRLAARFSEADWIGELTGGVSYLFFLRDLLRRIDTEWEAVYEKLEEMRRALVCREGLLANVTVDAGAWKTVEGEIAGFLNDLPEGTPLSHPWAPEVTPFAEGLTMPSPVNYVGKAAQFSRSEWTPHGSSQVILKHLRTTWLWEKVRTEGGAYGAFCSMDRLSRVISFGSYRDPNLLKTIDAYDRSGEFLRGLDLSERDLTRAIIGAISDLDAYQLPDAKGFTSMARWLIGETNERIQEWRDQVLGTTREDFRDFASVLDRVAREGAVAVLGSAEAIYAANQERGEWLSVTPVL